MKTFLALALTLFCVQSAQASTLAECSAKLESLLSPSPKTTVMGPAGNANYQMAKDASCGVELDSTGSYFTVTRFNGARLAKFETIVLSANELTAGGRVKGELTCEIDGDTVFYTARLPIFSDGVRSPFQIKTLVVSKNGPQLAIFLKSKLALLSSTVGCTVE